MQHYLETERLILRRFTADDLDALYELDADPEVTRFINGGRPTPREEIRDELLPRFIAQYEQFPGYGRWAAVEKAGGAFLGWFALTADPAEPGTAELGYRLRRSAWGRGYATEGARALVDKGFAELGMRRVTANTMTVNTGSRRVMEKTGLRFLRTFFLDWPDQIEGGEHGDVEYELLREEWSPTS
ncbi:GNAT family N-acetyltransferase [Catellatospora bangladeshensis]|uniref:GNAT family acetyltransferase n=1 Tax=Catellatospora bangladeshensis TaxID=310355 RepID=A0A8J3NNV1_9ACTN|nr:GNAT family N-acetyltransferase [Catellatospora bangladeshensis]GIF85220.1 GNAT family acetyltransferase [Catellatospora bangladeshensis]